MDLRIPLALAMCAATALAQETRGVITGTVRDATGAAIPGAGVVITNEGTNVRREMKTNSEGIYTAPYLVVGNYRIRISADGFKEHVREAVRVSAEGRHAVDTVLEVGGISERITVSSDAIAVDAASATGATFLGSSLVAGLPLYGGNANLLARLAPGVHITGALATVPAHDIRPQVAVTVAGGVGFPEFSVDGIPNRNEQGRISYAPHSDTVEELKVDTANFDASQGHTSNIRVNVTTKSGTNEYHGAANWQHWQQRWNATRSLVKAARGEAIAQALAAGNTAEAERLRGAPYLPAGRENTYAITLGGPVSIPKLFDGRNRLFFFFGYNGYKRTRTTEGFYTVPTAAQREGDFSNLLAIPGPIPIYDPRTARTEAGRVVRDPFPNNRVPLLNPVYRSYVKWVPLPNNSPRATVEGINNYFAAAIPQLWDFATSTGRGDWYISSRHKLYGRYHYSNFDEDQNDFGYEVQRGVLADRFNRKNWGILLDHVFTISPSTILNASISYNSYDDANVQTPIQLNTKPSDVSLPKYIEERAGEWSVLPRMGVNGYIGIGTGRRSGYNTYTMPQGRAELSKMWAAHSVKTGFDLRRPRRSEFFPAQTSGNFTFGRDYTRRTDLASSATTDIGLAWAAFLLGVPSSISLDTRTPADRDNLAAGVYLHDDWKVTRRLTLNLGLRFEREGESKEARNRFINYFNQSAELPFSKAAEAAYLRSPLPERPSITVRGGGAFAGVDGAPEWLTPGENMWMPRLGFAYQVRPDTVVRAGYGLF